MGNGTNPVCLEIRWERISGRIKKVLARNSQSLLLGLAIWGYCWICSSFQVLSRLLPSHPLCMAKRFWHIFASRLINIAHSSAPSRWVSGCVFFLDKSENHTENFRWLSIQPLYYPGISCRKSITCVLLNLHWLTLIPFQLQFTVLVLT